MRLDIYLLGYVSEEERGEEGRRGMRGEKKGEGVKQIRNYLFRREIEKKEGAQAESPRNTCLPLW